MTERLLARGLGTAVGLPARSGRIERDAPRPRHAQRTTARLTGDSRFRVHRLRSGPAYELLRQILDEDHQFLVRVGANVRLLRSAGYVRRRGEFVFLWPDRAVRKSHPPLVMRVIRVHDDRQPMMLVTSIRDPRHLSDSQALSVYRRR